VSEISGKWTQTFLGEVVQLNPKSVLDDELKVGFSPMAMIPKDYRGVIEFEERLWGKAKKGYTHFQDGDVLFAKVTPCFENGKAVFVTGLPNGKGAGSTEYFVLRPYGSLIEPKYLLALVKTKDFLRNGATNMTGSVGLKRVPKEFVQTYPLPLPPLAEQKEIAARLDNLLAQVDSIKTRLDSIPTILKRFRQSVLAAAVSGKLTEEWREVNEVSIEKWVSTNIGALAQVATGKTPKRTNVEYWDGGDIPWLTSAATGSALTFEAEQFVTELAVKECTLKLFPMGTLLLAMYGEGKTRGQVTELRLEATCNQACAAILVDVAKVSKEFLKLRLQENYEETRKAAVGGAQPNLNLNKVREIPVNLPSESEQTEIVRRVE